VAVNATSVEALLHLGIALISAGQVAEAEKTLREAVRLNPAFVDCWDKLAYCLKAQDRLQEAVGCHQRAVDLDPKRAATWCNFGLTLGLMGQNEEALKCHRRAAEADPKYSEAYFGLAQALQRMHRNHEAVAAYDRFLILVPSNVAARSYRLLALNHCEGISREALFLEHVRFGEAVGPSRPPGFQCRPDPERRLRVAFLSPDLRTHSCAYFLEPLLRHLPSEQFELLLYHDHFRTDDMSARLRGQASVWRNFVGQPNRLVESTIRSDGPDVLFDLAGHTGMTNRLPLFARHLAPVQITYLGYPNTTGVPAMGYRFTDAVVDPEGEADAFATEKLVRFSPTAWCYAPPREAPPVAPLPALRDGAVITFGCFNTPAKFSDSMFAVWGEVLRAVPGSRLVLKGQGLGESGVRAGYVDRFVQTGIDPSRVEFIERTAGTAEHLALYHRVDVALDTFPYHGTTTTCEAMWMGCPVVTLLGDRHAARVTASLVTAVGHPEWVARSRSDYVAIAAGLASDVSALAGLRARLRSEMENSGLLDHAGQASRFGAAIRACWREWCQSASAPRSGVG
jgi:predicted O-linked N-acetylglucosamine transferase (SPINDLY family)